MSSTCDETLQDKLKDSNNEAWAVRRTDERRLISAEMHLLRRTPGYTR
jgi:hypothetical protein